ncbi:EamA/RhaT family transporter [Thermococcus sp. CX2]|uniref:DMT family transporter n=1 Tax=Thermococcus sp. CX2 TaxID=163006 RepID=UPI00143AB994|nr:EamA/RhaT family transporter [Thermococcus sp. CX2]
MNGRIKIIVSMLIWGSVGIFARFSNLSGLGVAFFRVSLGALVLFLVFGAGKKTWIINIRKSLKEKQKALVALGIALALNWVFLFTAFNYTTIAKAVLVYYLAPVIATLISWRFLGERLTVKRWALVGLAFFGLLLIMSGEEMNFNDRDFLGIIFALTAAFFYALIPNLGRFLRNVDSSVLTFLQLAIASMVLAPFIVVSGVGNPVWWAVTVLVIVHTAFALLIYMDGLKEVEVNEAAILSYLDPLSAVVYAFIVFSEVPELRTVIGGALILLASLLDIWARGS